MYDSMWERLFVTLPAPKQSKPHLEATFSGVSRLLLLA